MKESQPLRSRKDAAPPTAAGGSRRWRRWLLRALLAVAVLQGLYLAAANAFLRTSAGHRLINRDPEKLQVSWGSAWTLWPGRVQVTQLHAKGQSRRVRWEVELDRVSVGCFLPALAVKRFSAREVSGQGLALRLLRRPEPGGPAPDPDATPVISGFPGPLESPAGGSPPPPRRWPWTVALSGVSIDEIREVWIEEERFLGDGRVTGGVEAVVHGSLEIRPSTVELTGGRIRKGEEVISEEARLFFEGRSDPFVPRETRGRKVLRFISGRVRFESPRTGFGFLDDYFRRAPWIDVGGSGKVEVDAVLDRGKLAPGSWTTVEARELALDALEFRTAGHGEIRAEVTAAGDGVETRLAATFQDFDLDNVGGGRPPGGQPLVRGSGFDLVARSSEADLVDGFGHLQVELTVPRSEVPDLTAFNRFLPAASDLQIDSGHGEFQGRLVLDSAANSGSGELEVHAAGVGLTYHDDAVFGDVELTARLRGADLVQRRFDVSGSRFELENFDITPGESGAGQTGWWGNIELREGELRTLETPGVDALLVAEIRDSGPLAAYLAERKPKLHWFRKLMTVDGVTAEGRLTASPETWSVGDVRIAGEKLEILATALHLAHGRRDGLFFFQLGPLSAAVEIEGEERDWKLTHSRRWYEQRVEASRRSQSRQ